MQLEHVQCNLCAQDNQEILFHQHDLLTDDTTEFSEVKCRNCGLVYIDPRPTMADIGRFYPQDFVSYQFDIYDPPTSVRERMVNFLTRSSADQRVQSVGKLVQLDEHSKVLDVGCGKAGFLYALRQLRHCKVAGLDFDHDSVAYCREKLHLDVVQGSMDKLDEMQERYDLITMWHFLEHEYDPLATLRKLQDRLEPGGSLIVEVPNQDSLENRIFGKRSYLYDVPRHLYNFSPTTLSGLLEKAGYEVVSIRYPTFSGGFIGTFQELLFRGWIYKRLKANVFLFFVLSLSLFPLDFLSALMKRGSVMTVLAKKANRT